jgi:hypothetical protein
MNPTVVSEGEKEKFLMPLPGVELCILLRGFMVLLLCFQMVFLPEACDFIGEKRSQFVENAEPINGETVHSFCQMAKENKIWLSLGGILEKVNQYIRTLHLSVFSLRY